MSRRTLAVNITLRSIHGITTPSVLKKLTRPHLGVVIVMMLSAPALAQNYPDWVGLSAMDGGSVNGSSGMSITSAGDMNGDGLDDLLITNSETGESYVVYAEATQSAPMLTCNGLAVTVNLALGQNPTNGDDVILGTEGPDLIRALDGNDTICGLGGSDVINAGSGDDWVDGGAGGDLIFGLSGNDVLRGRSGADSISGGSGDDLINGDGGSDFVNGSLGDDLVFGGGGQDGVFGSAGQDVLFGGPGDDSLFGGSSADRINGGAGSDNINGGNGFDDCIIDSADAISNCE